MSLFSFGFVRKSDEDSAAPVPPQSEANLQSETKTGLGLFRALLLTAPELIVFAHHFLGKKRKFERGAEFQESWFADYKWLDKEQCIAEGRFICRFCTIANVNNNFNANSKQTVRKGKAAGESKSAKKLKMSSKKQSDAPADSEKADKEGDVLQLRSDRLDKHETSSAHNKAVLFCDNLAKGKEKSVMQPMTQPERDAITKCAKAVLWLAKEQIAHAKFSSLRELLKDLGVDFSAINDAYAEDKFVRQILESLAFVTESSYLQHVQSSPAVSGLVDESTDNAKVKELMVFVRYLHGNEAKLALLKCIDLPDGKAGTIYEAVSKLLTEKGIRPEQLLGFGSDGAATMTGLGVCVCLVAF
jgi:hypothetical protein